MNRVNEFQYYQWSGKFCWFPTVTNRRRIVFVQLTKPKFSCRILPINSSLLTKASKWIDYNSMWYFSNIMVHCSTQLMLAAKKHFLVNVEMNPFQYSTIFLNNMVLHWLPSDEYRTQHFAACLCQNKILKWIKYNSMRYINFRKISQCIVQDIFFNDFETDTLKTSSHLFKKSVHFLIVKYHKKAFVINFIYIVISIIECSTALCIWYQILVSESSPSFDSDFLDFIKSQRFLLVPK